MKKISKEGIEKSKNLKWLILILVLEGLIALVWFLNYFIIQGSKTINPQLTTSPSIFASASPSPVSSATPTLTPTPEPSPSATPTPEPTNTDTPSSSPIPIVGDESCVSDTNAALELLSARAPVHYNASLEYIGLIECAPQGSGIFVWENPPRYKVGDSTRQDSGTMWYASTFPHEACHTKQYRDGRSYFGELAETECLNAQYSALEQMGASQSTLDYVRGLAATKYWEVPYENRWW